MRINEFIPNSKILDKISNDTLNQENKSEVSQNFSEFLKEKLDDVNERQINAENSTEAFLRGDNVELHDVMISAEEAKMSLEMAVQIRNKLVEAYQEINRMQL